jgi:hypothetical protein
MKRPEWWDWELRLSSHLLDRMLDRGFSEADLRLMIENATAVLGSGSHRRWVLQTSHHARRWRVIVEPDHADLHLVIVTAFPVDQP